MAHEITATDSMFSVREMPWHGLGVVLDEYPSSIEEALLAAGMEWQVESRPIYLDPDHGPVSGYKANVRRDNGEVLGIVSDEYEIVQNKDGFKFLDALISSDLHFETAGSLQGGKRVWVLARVPEFVEVGGDDVGTFVYVANAHDGTMAVTAAVTPVRIVCANTLGAALRRSEGSERTFKFRHTGDLDVKFEEARKVMGMTIDYASQFKVMGDRLAQERFTRPQMERLAKTLSGLPDPDLGDRARGFRERKVEAMVSIFDGKGPQGDTSGNSPKTKWNAWNAVAEYADYGRRVTKNTSQIRRSFEDTDMKDRALAILSE